MGKRILVVDDNPTNLKLVSYLVKAQGYEVETAADAEAALTSIARARPDLVTMEHWDTARHTKEWNTDPERWERSVAEFTAR